nr:7-deoxyloganetic acid glucosyltransferase-like [Tanacetum cinerariifolium]
NDLDVPVKSVPGTEHFLRRRDLPGFYRRDNLTNHIMQIIINEATHVPRAHGVIINTFEVLDEAILAHLRKVCPNIYCIGPLHTLFKSCMAIEPKPVAQMHKSNGSNSLWEENRSCLSWLDTKPAKSVIYVSIGSLAIMTVDQFFEIWHGLVNSGKPFLIVKRPGSVIGDDDDKQVPKVLVDATKERGFIAQWVPQEEVLAHSSIGGFLTHSGWNSTMESIVEGVPMICWPLYVDQQVNSRFVSEVWKIGLDIKDTSDKVIIEKAVNDIINVRRNEFIKSANILAESAAQSVTKDGSSFKDLNRLIKDLDQFKLLESLEIMTKPVFKEWLTSEKCGRVSCIISDGNMGFVYDVGNEIQVPVFSALTLSPTSLWVVYNLFNLSRPGEVSDLSGSDLNSLIKRVPGIKGVLTGGDLASMCQSSDLASPSSNVLMKQFKELSRAHGVIFNTCKALDGSILSRIRSFCPNIYAIGPVHTHLAVRKEAKNIEPLLNYSVDENKNCLAWLDTRQPKSVVYVNIENEVKLTRVQVLELWHGLVNSGKGFLWVGVDMEGNLDRSVIEKTIRDVMESKGELVENATKMKYKARKSVSKDGSSYAMLEHLVDDIKNLFILSPTD